MKNKAEIIAWKVLTKFKVKTTRATVKKFLDAHPVKNSIASVVDLFSKLNVQHALVYLNERTLPHLSQFPSPFITFVNSNDGEMVMVEDYQEGHVFYYSVEDGRTKTPLSEFKHAGVALVVKDTTSAGEQHYLEARLWELGINIFQFTTVALFITVLSLYVLDHIGNVFVAVLLLLKLIGCSITSVIILRDFKIANISNKICGKSNKNCAELLDSRASYVYDNIKWVDLGIAYFLGGLISLLLLGNTINHGILVVNIMNIVALPFIVYSLFYQIKTKQYCVLCLLTVAVLVGEFIVLRIVDTVPFQINWQPLLVALFSYMSAFSLFIWLKPFIKKGFSYDDVKEELNKYKLDEEIFLEILKRQDTINDYNEIAIKYLPSETDNELLIVTDPFCKRCEEVHREIHSIPLHYRNNVSVVIIFNSVEENEKSKLVSNIFCLIYQKFGIDQFRLEYEKWYDEGPSKRFPVLLDLYHQNQLGKQKSPLYERQRKFIDSMGLDFSPVKYYNSFRVPDVYSLDDITFFANL